MEAPDVDVLIIGAGMSGIGFAVQLIRRYNLRSFEIVEKTDNIGGTWFVNTYPGCGCDVPSHFYSYSFALNPNWSHVFSMRSEIQMYFLEVAEKYRVTPHVRFQHSVQEARWCESEQLWEVRIWDAALKETIVRRSRILISAVGSLSIPNECNIPGADIFKGPVFHSARWDSSFDWSQKDIVVVGNGCSATQFVPVMAQKAKSIVQFARQPHYLAERPNPPYSSAFKTVMKYFPGIMRLYRFQIYAYMEKDFAGFYTESGADIREDLKLENEKYVKRMAPKKYWDALIPKHEIGCKRKVMDTDYLATLHRPNVELIHDDPIGQITESGVVTKNGRHVGADAVILATGFQVFRMLHPMKIIGTNGMSLNEYWDANHQGAAQAYLGTCVPGFKNFFTLMGPNTVTGHQSVIYTVECQINFVLRLIEPIVKSLPSRRGLLSSPNAMSVQVKHLSAKSDSDWMQAKLKTLVWSSGCTSWALDPETGMNIAMYPQYQFMFWLRSIFIPSADFEYVCAGRNGWLNKELVVGGWKWTQRSLTIVTVATLISAGIYKTVGFRDVRSSLVQSFRESMDFCKRTMVGTL